ncbi:MAG: phosphoribosylformylglycinamidine synthase subunit PurQ [Actinomycetota bacterium]
MPAKFGVVVFPGSNCDTDCYYAAGLVGGQTSYIWHQDKDVSKYDCVILPGGFSYGDYLRTGAVAKFSPVMDAILDYADKGGHVIGICNGFQILLEAGLLPGAMLRNRDLKFICRYVTLSVGNSDTAFTNKALSGEVIRMPIAHNEGNYYADVATLAEMNANGQIVLRYCDSHGEATAEANPNGSLENIAGIVNKQGNVFGLMPHPERAIEDILGSHDGQLIFKSVISAVSK